MNETMCEMKYRIRWVQAMYVCMYVCVSSPITRRGAPEQTKGTLQACNNTWREAVVTGVQQHLKGGRGYRRANNTWREGVVTGVQQHLKGGRGYRRATTPEGRAWLQAGQYLRGSSPSRVGWAGPLWGRPRGVSCTRSRLPRAHSLSRSIPLFQPGEINQTCGHNLE